ncbi:MAG TPA: SCO family protein [candidate division Zixibacteria bacterium]|nr:SCO family protein [candidate division Zixibacteria bacterium]
MNLSRTRLLLLALCVLTLGVASGTALWIKLGPLPGAARSRSAPLEGLNDYGAVPDFRLTERSGRAVGLGDLRGAVWVADFIYTSCTDTCPLQTAQMARLQRELRDFPGVRLVSISVDPEKDSPAVLSAYADRYRADASRWLFLTGERSEIVRLVQNGFRLSAVAAADDGVILHSPRFVLVDREARIRGYYDSRDPEALKRLLNDLGRLAGA